MRTIDETFKILDSSWLWDGSRVYYQHDDWKSIGFAYLDLSCTDTAESIVRTMRELCCADKTANARLTNDNAMREAIERELGCIWIIDSPDAMLENPDDEVRIDANAFCAKAENYYRTLRGLCDDSAFDKLTAGFVINTLLANHVLPDDVEDAELRLWTSGKIE